MQYFNFLLTNFRINFCPVCKKRMLSHTTRPLNLTEEDMPSTSNDNDANSEQASNSNVHTNDHAAAGVASKSPNAPTMFGNANGNQQSGILTEQNSNIDKPNQPTSDRASVLQLHNSAKALTPKNRRPIPNLLFVGKKNQYGSR